MALAVLAEERLQLIQLMVQILFLTQLLLLAAVVAVLPLLLRLAEMVVLAVAGLMLAVLLAELEL